MPLDFPSSPVVGQYYNGYIWDGTVWDSALQATPPALLTTLPVYANVAGRSTALPNPSEGQLSYLNDSNLSQVYDGSVWKGIGGMANIVPPTIALSGGSATANTLGTVTFSNVSSISLNNVFSSTYKNYKLILTDLSASAGSPSLMLRMRSAGADNVSSTYYQYQKRFRLNGTVTDNSGGPSTGYSLLDFDTSTTYSWNWYGDINAPFTARNTTIGGLGFGQDVTSTYQVASNVLHGTASSFDGITFYPSAGNMSGSVQILGYNS